MDFKQNIVCLKLVGAIGGKPDKGQPQGIRFHPNHSQLLHAGLFLTLSVLSVLVLPWEGMASIGAMRMLQKSRRGGVLEKRDRHSSSCPPVARFALLSLCNPIGQFSPPPATNHGPGRLRESQPSSEKATVLRNWPGGSTDRSTKCGRVSRETAIASIATA